MNTEELISDAQMEKSQAHEGLHPGVVGQTLILSLLRDIKEILFAPKEQMSLQLASPAAHLQLLMGLECGSVSRKYLSGTF